MVRRGFLWIASSATHQLEGVYGPGYEHDADHQREHTLNHCQDLASSRQYGRVGWSERCARGKGHEHVVQEIQRPADSLLTILLSDLRDQEILAGVNLPGTLIRPSAVDLPVPHREGRYGADPDEHRVDQYREGGSAPP